MAIVHAIIEFLGYIICITALRVLTFGWVRAGEYGPDGRASIDRIYFHRDLHGRIFLHRDLAALIGLVLICLMIAAATYTYRNFLV